MSDMKCPICGGKMIGNIGSPICHYNQDCPIHDRSVPQEIYDLLERTCKALDIAKDALGTISQITKQIDVRVAANIATETIMALEQKDVK